MVVKTSSFQHRNVSLTPGWGAKIPWAALAWGSRTEAWPRRLQGAGTQRRELAGGGRVTIRNEAGQKERRGEALLHRKSRLGHSGHAWSLVPGMVRPSELRPVRGLP